MSKIAAVIFDMNGVIVDDEPLHEKAFKKTFEELGYSLSSEEYLEIFAGRTDKAGFELAFKRKSIKADIKECLKRKSYHYQMLAKNNLKPFPGIIVFICAAYNNYPIALASSSFLKEIDVVLTTFGIREMFKVIVSCEDVKHGKPHPEMYITTAQRLGVNPLNCLVIEDSQNGILAAKAAKMKCLAVTNTYPPKDLYLADLVIESFEDVDINWVISKI